jgi:2-dehydro-3-deoxyphosphooctonate aldolase (KDO 8-P synthase)
VKESADVLQIPAFLCRQTDFVLAVARSGKVVNVKKGQFLAPWDVRNIVEKIVSTGNEQVMVTERGASFGYNNLVSDMRSLVVLSELGYPVVFDATHSLQLPGGLGKASGGERRYIPALARAAVAVGIDALFMEVHENPDRAPSDGPNSLPLGELEELLKRVKEIDALLKNN